MTRPAAALTSFALGCLVLAQFGAAASAQSRKPSVLPGAATDTTSTASRAATLMVVIEERGTLASEPKATCDNQPSGGNFNGSVNLHLEHYLPDGKMVFDMKVGTLHQTTVKQLAENDADSAKVVAETIDGAEVAYFTTTTGCVQDVNPTSTKVDLFAHLIRDTTYAEIRISMFAATPDAPRKYLREMVQKIAALDYASIK